jgi:hypothetical protein
MHVFLVGVNHAIQWSRSDDSLRTKEEVGRFEQYLAEQCQRHQIELLAEEWSQQFNRMNKVTESTVQSVAAELNMQDLLCDPEERAPLDFSADERERIWRDCIFAAQKQRILFVCGDDHLDSFRTLLQESGCQASILSRERWGRNIR